MSKICDHCGGEVEEFCQYGREFYQCLECGNETNKTAEEAEINRLRAEVASLKEERAGRWCPDACPITRRPFFMWIEHPEKGLVPTYGGPFDSYTLAEPDEEGTFFCERFDHDLGAWRIDETEGIGLRLIDDQREDHEYGTAESLTQQLAAAREELRIQDAQYNKDTKHIHGLGMHLAAAQLYAKQLREALTEADEVMTDLGWSADRGLLLTVKEALAATTPDLSAIEGRMRDAERYAKVLEFVGAFKQPPAWNYRFQLQYLNPVEGADLFRGSVAQHFTAAIDYAIAAANREGIKQK